MKLVIDGQSFEARLEYVASQDRLMLRTAFAVLAPESARLLDVRLLEATGFEVELLRVSGYGALPLADPVAL